MHLANQPRGVIGALNARTHITNIASVPYRHCMGSTAAVPWYIWIPMDANCISSSATAEYIVNLGQIRVAAGKVKLTIKTNSSRQIRWSCHKAVLVRKTARSAEFSIICWYIAAAQRSARANWALQDKIFQPGRESVIKSSCVVLTEFPRYKKIS